MCLTTQPLSSTDRPASPSAGTDASWRCWTEFKQHSSKKLPESPASTGFSFVRTEISRRPLLLPKQKKYSKHTKNNKPKQRAIRYVHPRLSSHHGDISSKKVSTRNLIKRFIVDLKHNVRDCIHFPIITLFTESIKRRCLFNHTLSFLIWVAVVITCAFVLLTP